jgi:hypothetical protein
MSDRAGRLVGSSKLLLLLLFLPIALLATCFEAAISLGLFFYPEDGGDMFLRNVGWLSTDYTALYPRR